MAGDAGKSFDVVGEVGFVEQQIDAADSFDVVGVGCGRRVGDVGQRMAGPIEPKAERTARMLQRKIRERAAVGQRARVPSAARIETAA